ncbi:hypothetical protein BB559_005442 [Furculomyces boomerangus]|uniref:DNA polymerase epsilon catalytic subunit A n=1 Tax=Furculomyces boomerangus TaxID=61424 RepID=A0A2T9Y8P5_9FUNG|nr:hypothetical protein BB559_005442 [Furculomyces boomerangus]
MKSHFGRSFGNSSSYNGIQSYRQDSKKDYSKSRLNNDLKQTGYNESSLYDNSYFSDDQKDVDLSYQFPEKITNHSAMDNKMGFEIYQEGPPRIGWLVNMHPTSVADEKSSKQISAIDYYFLGENGTKFKSTMIYRPYFLVVCSPGTEAEVEEWIKRKFDGLLDKYEQVEKEDLDMNNHLTGKKRLSLKLQFLNIQDLLSARKTLMTTINKNKAKQKSMTYSNFNTTISVSDPSEHILELREYDIPYYQRVAIDQDIRVGLWYQITFTTDNIALTCMRDMVKRPDPVVLAFDIETTKLPLKFPDASSDMIMMISYMIDGQGYLITNRDIVSEDIDDFEYTPKEEFQGPFTIFNEDNEKGVIVKFFEHIIESQPTVLVTYNGDSFDWPFVHARAEFHGLDLLEEIGWYKDEADVYVSRQCNHMDCFKWVKRDSYLPVGSQGLKAVTTAKLGYNPMELDPEDMTRFASENPQTLAQYSVSDAVATYYLYMKYVHPFIFSLCNIIPFNGDDVLRKGSGTLCEALLMVEAYKASVLIPNKHLDQLGRSYNGHLIENETYVGGHVEALEAGVFRSDIPMSFNLDVGGIEEILNDLDQALKFSIEVEGNLKLDEIENYDEVKDKIQKMLISLREKPVHQATPLLYHLDVAAMYPNIILTNRLQPDALIDESVCASCDFNLPGKLCDRKLTWLWRGEYYPATSGEVNMLKAQLAGESATQTEEANDTIKKSFYDVSESRRAELIKKRVREYSRKVYNKVKEIKIEERTSIVCQRENPFYIDTVRNFRDRRYVYKELLKKEKQNYDTLQANGNPVEIYESSKLMVTFDSLQLAHKCILNSFYGYVMRRGARWHSLEMAGIVCYTGSKIIQLARRLIEKLGRPLELDTDGIWCALPGGFPENFEFKVRGQKRPFRISYPCSMLNHLVHAKFTNHQYQDRIGGASSGKFETRSENSIFFEIDGPYRAMILPASTQADKLLKKRYAVFNSDGSLAELKGFEVKRRGELKLIKIFQTDIFSAFLKGDSLLGSYGAVAEVANRWLDLLYSRGAKLQDSELFELLTENRNMSRSLENYGNQKSTAICTARRLAEFLGDQMVKDAGLACKLVISSKPLGTPVSERAIPVAIFSAEDSVKSYYLRRWLNDQSLNSFDIRDILDWNYYLERFGSVIQKLITIPAAMQNLPNPIPRIKHPDWLALRVQQKANEHKQTKLTSIFMKKKGSVFDDIESNMSKTLKSNEPINKNGLSDIEDIGKSGNENSLSRNNLIASKKRKLPYETTLAEKKLDLFSVTGNPSSALKMLVSRDPKAAVSALVDAIHDLGLKPDPNTDYIKYLEYSKSVWRYQRQIKKISTSHGLVSQNRALDNRNTKLGHSGPKNTLGQFFENTKANLVRNPLYIIQISESQTPGILKLWVLVFGQLITINLSVHKLFYVLSSTPNRQLEQSKLFAFAPKNLILPRMVSNYFNQEISNHETSTSSYLYQCRIAETLYLQNESTWSSFFSHPDIGGVFETKITSMERALIQLGSRVSLSKNSKVLDKLNTNNNSLDIDLYDLISIRGASSVPEIAPQLAESKTKENKYSEKGISLSYTTGYSKYCRENLNYIYVFNSVLPSSGRSSRGLISLFMTSTATCHVYAIDVDKQNTSSQLRNMEKVYEEIISQMNSKDLSFEYPPKCNFEVTITSSLEKAYSSIHKVLAKYLSTTENGPTMAAYYSLSSFDTLLKKVRIFEEFPRMHIGVYEQDKNYNQGSLDRNNIMNNFNWHLNSSKLMIKRFSEVSEYIYERMVISELSDVPMGNLPADDPATLVGDLLLARKLIETKHILWWSSSGMPDLGGREDDETGTFGIADLAHLRSFGGNDNSDNGVSGSGREVLYLNNTGAYHSVNIEMEISNLVVNSILQSSHILELDGLGPGGNAQGYFGNDFYAGNINKQPKSEKQDISAIPMGNDNLGSMSVVNKNSIILGNSQTSPSLLQAIKSTIREFYYFGEYDHNHHGGGQKKNFKVKSKNDFSNFMAKSLFRYLNQEKSKLYDPIIANMLFNLVKKSFIYLQHELSASGTHLIFANQEKLILGTKKKTIDSAITFAMYLMKTIQKQPVLEKLVLEPKVFWGHLVWINEANFGGITLPIDKNLKKLVNMDNDDQTNSEKDNSQQNHMNDSLNIDDRKNEDELTKEGERIEMLWGIKDSLPKVIHEHFEMIVAEFLYETYWYHYKRNMAQLLKDQDLVEEDTTSNGLDQNSNKVKLGEIMADFENLEPKEFYYQLVGKKYSRKLFQAIPYIQKLSTEKRNSAEMRFPHLPGILPAENERSNVALEFIKALMLVFGHEEASGLRGGISFEEWNKLKRAKTPKRWNRGGDKHGVGKSSYDEVYAEAQNTRVLRRNLLKLIGVSEFSSSGFSGSVVKKNSKVVIEQVSCKYCYNTKDLDLTNDPEIVSSPSVLKCLECGNSYDKVELQEMLIKKAVEMILGYQQQDLVCMECGVVKQDNIGRIVQKKHPGLVLAAKKLILPVEMKDHVKDVSKKA